MFSSLFGQDSGANESNAAESTENATQEAQQDQTSTEQTDQGQATGDTKEDEATPAEQQDGQPPLEGETNPEMSHHNDQESSWGSGFMAGLLGGALLGSLLGGGGGGAGAGGALRLLAILALVGGGGYMLWMMNEQNKQPSSYLRINTARQERMEVQRQPPSKAHEAKDMLDLPRFTADEASRIRKAATDLKLDTSKDINVRDLMMLVRVAQPRKDITSLTVKDMLIGYTGERNVNNHTNVDLDKFLLVNSDK